MKNIDKELLERFFNDDCTVEETEQVLKWFDTPEGEKFLEESLNSDAGQFADETRDLGSDYPEPDSDQLLNAIHLIIRKQECRNKRKRHIIYPVFKAAAVVLVILTASYFYQFAYQSPETEIVEAVPIHYTTSDDEQRDITLGDGSTIRLNNNSEVWISGDYMSGAREIELQGEAFFEVMHDPEKPFIVYANESAVEVLGTSFNVKSYRTGDNIQVAVTEGRVSFRSNAPAGDQTVILDGGQYGFLDLSNNEISVEDFAIENYLAWMNGRLVFEDLSLDKVCLQLNRLYQINCSFENDALTGLKLTATFSGDSLERTLSVISLSLDIRYRLDNGEVAWIDERVEKPADEMVN